jgi:hypothetical protein
MGEGRRSWNSTVCSILYKPTTVKPGTPGVPPAPGGRLKQKDHELDTSLSYVPCLKKPRARGTPWWYSTCLACASRVPSPALQKNFKKHFKKERNKVNPYNNEQPPFPATQIFLPVHILFPVLIQIIPATCSSHGQTQQWAS